jgi:hypothetical protein
VLASIIIIAHNAAGHLDDCLGSLFRQTFPAGEFEVIWVDSRSTDGSAATVRERYPAVRLLELGENLGYRRGTNAGAALARGRYLVVLNQDTRLDREWLARLVSAAEADSGVGIVAPKILMFDQPETVNEAGNTLHFSGLYGSRGLGEPSSAYDRPETLATMAGCSFLIRRALWRRLEGFSDDFDQLDIGWHSSYEDVDLAWRAQLLGFRVVFEPRAVMYHKYTSKGLADFRFGSYEWGRALVVARNYHLHTLILLSPLLAAIEAGSWLYALAKGRSSLEAKSRATGWLLTHPGALRRMRRRVQAERALPDRPIIERMSPRIGVTHVLSGGRGPSLAQRALDLTFMAYYRFLLGALALIEGTKSPSAG